MSLRTQMLMWALLTLLLTAHPSAAQAQTAIPQSGSASVSAKSRKATANVTIHTVRIDSSNSAFPSDWESDTRAVTIVKDVNILIDNQSLNVPRSVFADLVDPREMSIRFEKGAFVLTVWGGDGADSYFVRVYFDMKGITRRMVYSLLIPDEFATLIWPTLII